MNEYLVEVRIAPRAGLLDPEGKAILHALHTLRFEGVEDVRADSPAAARHATDDMCRKLLANPVTEDFDILLQEGG